MTVHSPLALHGQSQHAQHPQPIRTSVELTSDETQHHHHHQVQNSEGGMGKGDAAYYALDLDDMSPHAPHAHSSGKKRWHVRENVWALQSWNRRLRYLLGICGIVLATIFIVNIFRPSCSELPSLARTLENEVAAGAHPIPRLEGLKDLVIVAGHAVYVGADFLRAGEVDSWYLEDYQKNPGQVASFMEHIQVAVREAARNPEALLLFSGGQTRLEAGPISEGHSYWAVAKAFNWFGETLVASRAVTEEYARDSYENLLFSLCRFHELTGSWPRNVTVVGYDFKEDRFMSLHRTAITFPRSRMSYIGTTIPNEENARNGEGHVEAAFRSDPYGCSEELSTKRNHRDPFARGVPYHARCSALRPLLNHCGPSIFLGKLPWNEDGGDAGGGAAPGGAEEAEGHALGRRGGGGVRSLATEAETQEEEG